MNLKSENIFIAVIILISMMVICHTAHFFYNKNKFYNITQPLSTEYNKIYYDDKQSRCNNNDLNKEVLEQILGQSKTPCPTVTKKCSTSSSLEDLSDSELAVLYKVAYENAGLEVLNRTLKNKK